jgi:hypothetical protein
VAFLAVRFNVFGTVNASLRYSVSKHASLQVSANNLTWAYGSKFSQWFGGLPLQFVTRQTAPTTLFTQGPTTFHFLLHINN